MFRTVLLSGGGVPAELKDGKTMAYWDWKTGVTQDGSGYVSSWLDRLNNVELAQASAGAQPLRANGIVFDGSGDFMKTAVITLAQPITVYIAVIVRAWTSGDYILDGNGNNSMAWVQLTSTPNLAQNAGATLNNGTNVLVAKEVHTLIYNGLTSSSQINNYAKSEGNVGGATPSAVTVCARGSGTQYGAITVYDVIVRTQVDSDSLQDKIKNYLARKNNIAL